MGSFWKEDFIREIGKIRYFLIDTNKRFSDVRPIIQGLEFSTNECMSLMGIKNFDTQTK